MISRITFLRYGTLFLLMALGLIACESDPTPTPACTPGDQGCECKVDDTCNGDLVCFNALCVPESEAPSPDTPEPTPAPDQEPTPAPDQEPEPTPAPDQEPAAEPEPAPAPDQEPAAEPEPVPAPDQEPAAEPEPAPAPDQEPDTPPEGLGLDIAQTNARACEVVLVDAEKKINDVTFTSALKGKFMRRGERVAIAFHATDDEALSTGHVAFSLADGINDLEGVTLRVSRCFDLQGQPLDTADITIVDNR